MPTIDATVGGPGSNSYCLLAEATAYFDERLPLPTPWLASGDMCNRALTMATRVLDSMAQPFVSYVKDGAYYITRKQWTGEPASTTQRLAWPRIGMFNRNGGEIAEDEIPQELKEATAELAGQLMMADTTLDNDVAVKGITSIKAGSVSLSFAAGIEAHVLPNAVLNLMPASWFTDEVIDYATQEAEFEVI
jgi:hypothetical protein